VSHIPHKISPWAHKNFIFFASRLGFFSPKRFSERGEELGEKKPDQTAFLLHSESAYKMDSILLPTILPEDDSAFNFTQQDVQDCDFDLGALGDIQVASIDPVTGFAMDPMMALAPLPVPASDTEYMTGPGPEPEPDAEVEVEVVHVPGAVDIDEHDSQTPPPPPPSADLPVCTENKKEESDDEWEPGSGSGSDSDSGSDMESATRERAPVATNADVMDDDDGDLKVNVDVHGERARAVFSNSQDADAYDFAVAMAQDMDIMRACVRRMENRFAIWVHHRKDTFPFEASTIFSYNGRKAIQSYDRRPQVGKYSSRACTLCQTRGKRCIDIKDNQCLTCRELSIVWGRKVTCTFGSDKRHVGKPRTGVSKKKAAPKKAPRRILNPQ